MPPKVSVTKSQKPTLSQLLVQIDLGEGTHLTTDQTNYLLSLEFPDGRKILSRRNLYLLNDVVEMLRRLPYDQVVNYLQAAESAEQLILDSPLLENEREIDQIRRIAIQQKLEVEGVYQCPSCHGWETTSVQAQVRSADEPMTTFVTCTSCGKHWRID